MSDLVQVEHQFKQIQNKRYFWRVYVLMSISANVWFVMEFIKKYYQKLPEIVSKFTADFVSGRNLKRADIDVTTSNVLSLNGSFKPCAFSICLRDWTGRSTHWRRKNDFPRGENIDIDSISVSSNFFFLCSRNSQSRLVVLISQFKTNKKEIER